MRRKDRREEIGSPEPGERVIPVHARVIEPDPAKARERPRGVKPEEWWEWDGRGYVGTLRVGTESLRSRVKYTNGTVVVAAERAPTWVGGRVLRDGWIQLFRGPARKLREVVVTAERWLLRKRESRSDGGGTDVQDIHVSNENLDHAGMAAARAEERKADALVVRSNADQTRADGEKLIAKAQALQTMNQLGSAAVAMQATAETFQDLSRQNAQNEERLLQAGVEAIAKGRETYESTRAYHDRNYGALKALTLWMAAPALARRANEHAHQDAERVMAGYVTILDKMQAQVAEGRASRMQLAQVIAQTAIAMQNAGESLRQLLDDQASNGQSRDRR